MMKRNCYSLQKIQAGLLLLIVFLCNTEANAFTTYNWTNYRDTVLVPGGWVSGGDVTIPSTVSIVYDGADGNGANENIGLLTVNGEFQCNNNISASYLTVNAVYVTGSDANFQCGTQASPFTQQFTLTLVEGSGATDHDQAFMVMSGGDLNLYGSFGSNTWTKVVETNQPGTDPLSDNIIRVLNASGWNVGDEITITSSEIDNKTQERFVGANANLIQKRTINAIAPDGAGRWLITLGSENDKNTLAPLTRRVLGEILTPTYQSRINDSDPLTNPLVYVNPYVQADLKDSLGNDLTYVNDQLQQETLYARLEAQETNYKGTGSGTLVLDQRTEVANTSRNIKIIGTTIMETDAYAYNNELMPRGVHMMFMGSPGQIHIDGIEVRNGGRMGELARYPIHWHVVGNREGDFVKNSSIVDSASRCVTVHGTNYVQVEKNVCVNHFGHGYFLEDGDEHGNRFIDNIAILGKPVVDVTVAGNPKRNHKALLESDVQTTQDRYVAPASFWISNPDNVYIGNVASSSGTGFWFSLKDAAHKVSRMSVAPKNTLPKTQGGAPLTGFVFSGNSAHTVAVGVSLDGGPNAACMSNPRNPCASTVGDFDTTQSFPEWTPESTTAHRIIADDFTGYRATAFGMWMGAFNGATIVNSVTADSRLDMGIVHSQNVRNSLLIGTTPSLTDAEYSDLHSQLTLNHFGRNKLAAAPYTENLFEPMAGFSLYDGPTLVQDIHFVDYLGPRVANGSIYGQSFSITKTPTPFTLFGAAALRSSSHQSTRLSFENTVSPRVDFKYALGHPAQENWSAMLYDIDGSLAGVSGATIVPNEPIATSFSVYSPTQPENCLTALEVQSQKGIYITNADVCPGRYGLMHMWAKADYKFDLTRASTDSNFNDYATPVTYQLNNAMNAYYGTNNPLVTTIDQFAFPANRSSSISYLMSFFSDQFGVGDPDNFTIYAKFLNFDEWSPEIKVSHPTKVCNISPNATDVVVNPIVAGVLSFKMQAKTAMQYMGPGVRDFYEKSVVVYCGTDIDSDGTIQLYDTDDDGDGILDVNDTYPLDTDNDGINNSADSDDDNDGLVDAADSSPININLPGYTALYTFNGDAAMDKLGTSVKSAGDVNGDGYDDLIVGSPEATHDGTNNSGVARVYSGLNGSILYTLNGAVALDNFGYSVAGGGDVNNDGYADVIVGAVYNDHSGDNAGAAYVYSGVSGALLYSFYGDGADDRFGVSVGDAGDVNNDGYADIIVGAHLDDNNGTDSGSVKIYSGLNGNVLYTFNGSAAGINFGVSVDGVGDVNNDGYGDVAVGAQYASNNGANSGSAYVFSGLNGSALYTFNGDSAEDWLGVSVSAAGDVNNDGYADVIVGAWLDDNTASDAGSARVYSGINGNILYTFNGSHASDYFGYSVAGAGDVNNDNYDDLIVGAYGDDAKGNQTGSVRVLSGQNGSVLYTIMGGDSNEYFGWSVSSAGDVDNDGYADVIVGAKYDDNTGSNSGSARVFSGGMNFKDIDADTLPNWVDTDDDGDGVLDVNDANPLIAVGNCTDTDSDGAPNTACGGMLADAFPLDAAESVDTDGDGIGNNSDPTPNGDTDGDGIDQLSDNCPIQANIDQLNTDSDAQGDVCDSDDDNDSILDGVDNCPLNANANQLDTDYDTQGDACDTDDDNDGMSDTWEISQGLLPLVNDASNDPDTDGYSNLQEYKNGTRPDKIDYSWSAYKASIGWVSGTDLEIPAGTDVVYNGTDIMVDSVAKLTVLGGFHCDNSIPVTRLQVEYIHVMGSGALFECGADASRPFTQEFELTFVEGTHGGEQAFMVMDDASLHLFGDSKDHNTWTKITVTAPIGSNSIQVLDASGWNVGDAIAIAASRLGNNQGSADASLIQDRIITAVTGNVLTLNANLTQKVYGEVFSYPGSTIRYKNPYTAEKFQKIAGNPATDIVDQDGNSLFSRLTTKEGELLTLDERTEVANKTRNIVFKGTETAGNEKGMHIMTMASGSIQVDGVEIVHGGRKGEIRRYPFHWHEEGDKTGDFIRNASVHDSFHRCIVVHGTYNVDVEKNVCVNTFGHTFFLEDGDEHGNVLVDNIAILTKPIDDGQQILASDSSILTVNQGRFPGGSAAAFWVSNPDNILMGNSASSAGTGFWYALKDAAHMDEAMVLAPNATNAGVFSGNFAHTTMLGYSMDGGPNGVCAENPRNPCNGSTHEGDHVIGINQGYIEGQPKQILVDNFTAYKSSSVALWLLSGHGEVATNSIIAESGSSAALVFSDDFTNSLVVGVTPALEGDIDNLSPFASQNPSGIVLYDGGGTYKDIHFAGYYATHPNIVPFSLTMAAALRAPHQAKNITFEENEVPRGNFQQEQGHPSSKFNWVVNLFDMDGSVGGVPGSSIVPNEDINTFFFDADDCQLNARLDNAAVCPGRYGLFYYRASLSEYAYNLKRVSTNPDYPANAIFDIPEPANGREANQFSFPIVRAGDFSYELTYHQAMFQSGDDEVVTPYVAFVENNQWSPYVTFKTPGNYKRCILNPAVSQSNVEGSFTAGGYLRFKIKANQLNSVYGFSYAEAGGDKAFYAGAASLICGVDGDGDGVISSIDADDDNDGIPDNVKVGSVWPACDNLTVDCDNDNDLVLNAADAFPGDPTESADIDGDRTGNNHDTDNDNDGILDAVDNCPFISNVDQKNADGDAQGDVCDVDDDNDGVNDIDDNCVLVVNPLQIDTEFTGTPNNPTYVAPDGYGNACDTDFNNDDVVNHLDRKFAILEFGNNVRIPGLGGFESIIPVITDLTSEILQSGLYDTTNPYVPGASCITEAVPSASCGPNDDGDGDGVINATDNCPTTFNTNQLDSDSDGLGDVCDPTP